MKQGILILIVVYFMRMHASMAQTTGDVCTDPFVTTLEDPTLFTCDYKQISGLDFNDYNDNTFTSNPGCSYGANNNDIWIKITIPANADGFKITMDSTLTSDNDYRNFMVATYTGSDCSSLTYNTCKTTSRKTLYNNYFDGLSPGTTVYARIYLKNSTSGTWNIPFYVRLTAINTLNSNDACTKASILQPGTYCNYLATDKNENDNKAPDKLTSIDDVCQPYNTAFGTYDNNQWYYFEVTASTPQPIQVSVYGVACSAGDQTLQAAIWKANALNCSNWGNGFNLSDPVAANDGDLLTCAAGSGTVTISKNLPVGKYWYTLDGSAGSFCKYNISTNVTPTLPLSFLNFYYSKQINDPIISWKTIDDQEVNYYVIERSKDGKIFTSMDTVSSDHNPGISMYQEKIDLNNNFYYRIKIVYKNNHEEYSELIYAKVTDQQLDDLYYEILSDGNILLNFKNTNDMMININLFDASGKTIYFNSNVPVSISKPLEIKGTPLAHSIYFLHLSSYSESTTIRIVH